MKEQLKQLLDFQTAYNSTRNSKPTLISEDDYILRYRLGKEELIEYFDACKDGNLVEVADALADQLYILLGTMISHGMQDVIEDIFDEVHRSNMSKLGSDGKPIYREDGKILKGPNFSPPNIAKYLSDDGQLEIPLDEKVH
jgi:predicted HAD superfamily Cof-like phosphohydrolase